MMSGSSGETTEIFTPRGSPIQIVNFRTIPGRQSQLILEKNALKQILLKVEDRPVYVLSIAGASRQGKSFLLTVILNLLENLSAQNQNSWEELLKHQSLEGFHFQNGTERQTVGLWLWSTPFIFRQSDGAEIAVLLMDSQGVFDEHTDKHDWSMIVGLNLLTSSCLIYNLFNNLQEDNLEILHNFVEFGMLSLSSDQDPSSVFQKLIFMIRDWNFPSSNPYGLLGGSTFLQEKLRVKPTMPQERRTVRETLKSCFEEVECFLLPNPGEAAKAHDFKGALNSLNPEFLKHLKVFVEDLLTIDDMKPKMIGGQPVRGIQLLSYFDKYIKAFNAQTLPKPSTLLEAMMEAKLETLTTACISMYLELMAEILTAQLVNRTELKTCHEKCSKEAINKFSAEAKGSNTKQVDKHRWYLTNELKKLFLASQKGNEDKKASFLVHVVECSKTKYKTMLDHKINEKTWLSDELDEILYVAKVKIIEEMYSEYQHQNPEVIAQVLPHLESALIEMDKGYLKSNGDKLRSTNSECEDKIQQLAEDYSNMMTMALENDDKMTSDKMLHTHEKCEDMVIKKFSPAFKFDNPNLANYILNKLKSDMKSRLAKFAENAHSARIKAFHESEKELYNIVDSYTESMVELINTDPTDKEFTAHHNCQILTASNKLHRSETFINLSGDKELKEQLETTLNFKIEEVYQAIIQKVADNNTAFQQRWDDAINGLHQKYETMTAKTLAGPKLLDAEEVKSYNTEITSKVLNEIEQLPWLPSAHQDNFRLQLRERIDIAFSNILKTHLQNIEQTEMECKSLISDQFDKYAAIVNTKTLKDGLNTRQLEEAHNEARVEAINCLQEKFQVLPPTKAQTLLNVLKSKLDNSFQENRKHVELQLEGTKAEAMDLISNCTRSYQSEMETVGFNTEFPTEELLQRMHDTCRVKVENQMDTMFKNYTHILPMVEIKKIFSDNIANDLKNRMAVATESRVKIETNLKRLRQDILDDYCNKFTERMGMARSDQELGKIHQDLLKEAVRNFEQQYPLQQNLIKFRQDKQILEQDLEAKSGEFAKRFQETSTQLDADTRMKILKIVQEYSSKTEKKLSIHAYLPEPHLLEMHSAFAASCLQKFQAMELPMAIAVDSDEYQEFLQHNLKDKFAFYKRKNQSNILVVEEQINQLINNLKTDFKNALLQIQGPEPDDFQSMWNEYRLQFQNTVKQAFNLPYEGPINYDFCHEKIEQALKDAYDEWINIEPDARYVELAVIKAKDAYSKDMDIRTKTNSQVNFRPEVLAEMHNRAVNQVMINFKKSVKCTPGTQKRLEALLKASFKKYIEENNLRASELVNPAIGIDLGTTYCCVSVYRNGKTEVIPNQYNHRFVTPSYILFESKNNIVVGHAAKNEAVIHPTKTIFDAKRLIGRKYYDPKTQEDIKLWPFKVVNSGGRPRIQVEGQRFLPEEVSSELLKKLKSDAEKYLGCTVENAVITVPAYFNDAQKVATKSAGASAGLNVLGLLNEPTAAAIAYSLKNTNENEKNVLVYDLGGGTFDVSVLNIKGGDIEVKAVGGNNHLGGQDFDNNMLKFCIAEFEKMHGISLQTTGEKSEISTRLRRIRERCEEAKITLSESLVVSIVIDVICDPHNLNVKITRQDFNKMNERMLQETIGIVTETLREAKLSNSDIDDVVLVGGSTRIPRVQELLKEFFNGKQLNMTLNPDEVVAHGAAIYAAMKNGSRERELGHIKFTDVAPLSLGIECKRGNVHGVFSILIPKNTAVPISKTKPYRTTSHSQTRMAIDIYEGEDTVAIKNNLLGSFVLTDIPPNLAGKEEVEVTIDCNAEGILQVKAMCKSTGGNKEITIESTR